MKLTETATGHNIDSRVFHITIGVFVVIASEFASWMIGSFIAAMIAMVIGAAYCAVIGFLTRSWAPTGFFLLGVFGVNVIFKIIF